jgi:hypothetical protein
MTIRVPVVSKRDEAIKENPRRSFIRKLRLYRA